MIIDNDTLIDLGTTIHKASEANLNVARACTQISKAVHGETEVPEGLWHTLVECLALNQGLMEHAEKLLLALMEANREEERHGQNG
jgi:hypothetical protein